MKPIVNETIEQLKHWKTAFLQSDDWSFEHEHGITELTDYLEGIYHDGHKCYASYLFNQLSDKDKSEISNALDFYVDFDGMYCIYDIPKGGE